MGWGGVGGGACVLAFVCMWRAGVAACMPVCEACLLR